MSKRLLPRCIPSHAASLTLLPASLLLLHISLVQAAPQSVPSPTEDAGSAPALRTFHGQPSFVLSNKKVEVAVTREGVPTALELTATKPTVVNYIQGVARIPQDFGNVQTLQFRPGEVTFMSTTGKRVTIPVRHEFLRTGKL